MSQAEQSLLGKKTPYHTKYDPSLLFPIPRAEKRAEIGIEGDLPFCGRDCWTAYEISWLDTRGKPQVAMGRVDFPCESPCLVESKSLKLYLNSFNQSRFAGLEEVEKKISEDLSHAAEGDVLAKLYPPREWKALELKDVDGSCLDDLEIGCDTYEYCPGFLATGEDVVEEKVYSHLLKSNCLVTGQPDWGTVQISYRGPKINHAGLLRYIVSFRNHQEFHEQCVERIFVDLISRCNPHSLTVLGAYTRRGGLDINPIRSTEQVQPFNKRFYRQ